MQEGLKSYINLFADDAKLLKVVCGSDDCMELQRNLDKLYEWSVNGNWNLMLRSAMCWRWGRVRGDPRGHIKWEKQLLQRKKRIWGCYPG